MGGYHGGSSAHKGMPMVRSWLKELRGQITTAVDFGIGQGYLGEQVRRYAAPGRLIGCDVYAPVVELAREREPAIYDEVHLSSLLDFVQHAPSGKGVLWSFGDVLEHVPEAAAHEVLSARSPGPEYILLRIPVGPYPQKGNKLNPAEAHLWTFFPDVLPKLKLDVRGAHIAPLQLGKPTFFDTEYRELYDAPFSYLGNFLIRYPV